MDVKKIYSVLKIIVVVVTMHAHFALKAFVTVGIRYKTALNALQGNIAQVYPTTPHAYAVISASAAGPTQVTFTLAAQNYTIVSRE